MDKIIIASGPVIVKNNKVLLNISGKDDFWKFCGGKIGEGEILKEAAIRRAKEEMGVDIEIRNNEPFFMYVPKPGEEYVDVILVHWLADYKGEIRPGKDVKKWDWFDINDLPDNLGPNIIPALTHFSFIK